MTTILLGRVLTGWRRDVALSSAGLVQAAIAADPLGTERRRSEAALAVARLPNVAGCGFTKEIARRFAAAPRAAPSRHGRLRQQHPQHQ